MNTRSLSFDEMKNRLIERVAFLEARMKSIQPELVDSRVFSNIKTELNTVKRRLKLLNEKVSEGRNFERLPHE